ncbi:5-bromo-4-chloroindolyl phosphate hydrolysis family protein [Metabacillus fastidiosus]|uniref:5-bromo-4-chloroindolyl phosphate hydrolysis family protein n=1 Tax=Metabacillus fastidiosus TaxID=1458 RepID=UPI002DB9249F|nr:5-bromo-4-chloroindolyl phosphate hydrolysis family protein [Metabacillus fastidiosus]MEC2076083.1 5-bromo-4-chloroindolyl phosphate hydrolysis family protein [Metabacillus fastidiosus]
MNQFLNFLTKTSVSAVSTVSVWSVSVFAIGQPLLLSSLFAVGGGIAAYSTTSFITTNLFLKRHGLSRKEYKYIQKNLEEANKKIKRLRKSLISIRNIASIKQNIELLRVVNKIYSITKTEPRRFYLAEEFYYSHLDSLVELSEKHAFLAAQPKKSKEMADSLTETRETISTLAQSVEKDLYDVLAKDIDHLNFELDVAKLTIDKKK